MMRPLICLLATFVVSSSTLASPPMGTTNDTGDPQTARGQAPLALEHLAISQNEKAVIRYVATSVLPFLTGPANKKIEDAAAATWWSLNEGIARLGNPHVFSNCYPGEKKLGPLEECARAPDGKFIWQVGLAGIQVPDYSDGLVSEQAKELYPKRAESDLLEEAARLAGFSRGNPVYDGIIDSTKLLKRSWLLRHPVIGMSLIAAPVREQCFAASPKPWCTRRTSTTYEQLKTVFAQALETSDAVPEKGDGPFELAQLLASAKAGDPSSQLQLGIAYATGDGVGINGVEAVRWLENAADGSGKFAVGAASWLGSVYEHGLGVRKSGESAVKWYSRGAGLGSGASAQNLGEMYIVGKLVKRNEKLGYEWYARAVTLYEAEAVAGDALAAYRAALIYHRGTGTGVPPNPTKALALLEVASAAGNADAKRLLDEIRTAEARATTTRPAPSTVAPVAPKSCDDPESCVMQTLDRLNGAVDQFKIAAKGSAPLTAADRANGITEKWCLVVSAIYRHSPTSSWGDFYRVFFVLRNQRGYLPARMQFNYSGSEGEASQTYLRCLENNLLE